MINLYCNIVVKVAENEKLNPDHYYRVIGTYHRPWTDKDGKISDQDFFMVHKEDGTIINVFPSKCKVKRLESTF